MNIALFGSTGKTGKCLLEQALAQGHKVTAFARNPSAILIHHEHLRVLQGDVLNPSQVDAAIIGSEVVLSALGTGLSASNHVLSRGTHNIIASMNKLGVLRFICESSYGVAESYDEARPMARLIYRTILGKLFSDKKIQEEAIRQSGLEWIIVRPATLTNGPKTGVYRVAERISLGPSNKISRSDVADFMLKQLTDKSWVRKTPALAY